MKTNNELSIEWLFLLPLLSLVLLILDNPSSVSGEANLSQFVVCFVLTNIIYYFSYRNLIYPGTNERLLLMLILLFCLFNFWSPDFFSLSIAYESKEFEDFLYPKLIPASFGSYYLFRLYIWGGALLLLFTLVRKLGLSKSVFLFVFSYFFIFTFSYARASLGMALYYLGFYFLYKEKRSITDYILVIALFFLAFYAHRSMLIPIVLTLISFIPVDNKTTLLLLLAMFVLLLIGFEMYSSNINMYLMTQDGDLEAFSSSADKYLNLDVVREENWKFRLTNLLARLGYFVYFIYMLYLKFFYKIQLPQIYERLFTNSLLTFLISSVLLIVAGKGFLGIEIIGYRLLFITSIPTIVILSYLYQNKMLSFRMLSIILFSPFLYGESFILGKIISKL